MFTEHFAAAASLAGAVRILNHFTAKTKRGITIVISTIDISGLVIVTPIVYIFPFQ